MLVAGVDGGQSSTVAVVLDADGGVLGRGTAGPADHVDEPRDSRRAAQACERAVAAALAAGGQPADAPLAAVVIGLSGYEGVWHGVEPAFGEARVRYVHDAPIALAGAVEERPAGVVIAGTGSVGYGETFGGRTVTIGGYGYLFGDEGSSFAIARSAITGAMRAADAGADADLGAAALAFFDVPDLRALARAVSLHEISRPRLASFARVVHDAARLGDAAARAIVDEAAGALAALAVRIADLLEGNDAAPVPVAFVGGGFGNADFRASTEARFAAATARGRVAGARYEPAVGAALLAFDLAEQPRPAALGEPA
jgi:N-acetylglucosamine kinase-like BadF-type ATPase